jgi:hypothetical protein
MSVKEAQEMQGNVRKGNEVVAEKGCGVLATQQELRGIQRKISRCFLQFPFHSCGFLVFPAISLVIPSLSLLFLRFPGISFYFPRKRKETEGNHRKW